MLLRSSDRMQGAVVRVLLLVAALGFSAVSVGAEKPNVLLISIDDLNDWCGCLGGHPQAKTPNIDRLARRGTLFTNAHCQAPVCTPSRASLILGKLPSTTGMYFLRPFIPEVKSVAGSETLIQRFGRSGYETLGVGKINGSHDRRYFQKYGGTFGGFGPRPRKKISHPIGHPLWDWGAYPEKDEQMPDHKIASWAIRALKEKRTKPFFLAVGFYRPHVPMFAPQKWLDQHPLEKVEVPATKQNDREDLPRYAKDLTIGHPAPRHEWFLKNKQWKHAVQSYNASVSFVDHQVGRVLNALSKSDHAKNTIVVLFSDHGWHLGEKQRWAKRSLWEDSTRVPLVISLPGAKGQKCNKPVGLIDLFPTLLDVCKLDPQKNLEGHSLAPLLKNSKAEWKHVAVTTFGPHNHAIRSEHFRYIRYADGSEELYDHRADPHEWKNLAADSRYAEIIRVHKQHLPKINKPHLSGHRSSGLDAYLAAEKKRRQK